MQVNTSTELKKLLQHFLIKHMETKTITTYKNIDYTL